MLAHLQGIDRRERLRRLALETIDLAKDPYFMRNHLGQYECRLCLTLHTNEGNYLAHTQVQLLPASAACMWHLQHLHQASTSSNVHMICTWCHRVLRGVITWLALMGRWAVWNHSKFRRCIQGKRHQQNLAKRAAREAKEAPVKPAPKTSIEPRKTVKIGKPGYRVTKLYDQHQQQRHLLFQVHISRLIRLTGMSCPTHATAQLTQCKTVPAHGYRSTSRSTRKARHPDIVSCQRTSSAKRPQIGGISISCLLLNHTKSLHSRFLVWKLTKVMANSSRIGTKMPRCTR